jgi:glutamate 5-kinase
MAGLCGTRFVPQADHFLHARDRWIAFGATAKGAITVNDGAKRQIMGSGKSLLPAGVVEVGGHFHPGDLVRLMDLAGEQIAQGFVNYDSESLARIMGRQTCEIATVLGEAAPDEVIHRDNMVLAEV